MRLLLLAFFLIACGDDDEPTPGADASPDARPDTGGGDARPDSMGMPDVMPDAMPDAMGMPDAASDAAEDASRMGCAPDFLDGFEKGCTNDESCTFVEHQTNCCGTIVVVGINHSEIDRFLEEEEACASMYPACGCASEPTMTEDGNIVTEESPAMVRCDDDGTCRTYVLPGS